MTLPACWGPLQKAEVAAVREELDIVKSQLAMQPLSQPGRVSSLGYQSFVSSMLEATAAVAAAGDPGLAVPHHEAAAMPHDKLLALVMALQLDLQALQGELAGKRESECILSTAVSTPTHIWMPHVEMHILSCFCRRQGMGHVSRYDNQHWLPGEGGCLTTGA